MVSLIAVTAGCGSKAKRGKPTATVAQSVDVTKLAAKAFDQVKSKTPLDDDRRANAFIICVAEQVIRDMKGDWEIAIFRKSTPYAFVLPGRKIGVNSGMTRIARNQHQMAGLLAHSLGHVLAHHLDNRIAQEMVAQPEIDLMRALDHPRTPEAQRIFQLLGIETEGGSPAIPFDHAQEAEADAVGLELTARAGFDPRESLGVWRSIDAATRSRTGGLAALHPSHGSRSAGLQQQLEAAVKLQQQVLSGRKKPDCDRLR